MKYSTIYTDTYKSRVLPTKNETTKVVTAYTMANESRYLSGVLRDFAPSLLTQ